jgi:hypothetical protein
MGGIGELTHIQFLDVFRKLAAHVMTDDYDSLDFRIMRSL